MIQPYQTTTTMHPWCANQTQMEFGPDHWSQHWAISNQRAFTTLLTAFLSVSKSIIAFYGYMMLYKMQMYGDSSPAQGTVMGHVFYLLAHLHPACDLVVKPIITISDHCALNTAKGITRLCYSFQNILLFITIAVGFAISVFEMCI